MLHLNFAFQQSDSVTHKYICVSDSCSIMPDSFQPHRLACQAPLSMEFSRQDYWSGLPCPSPADLPDPGIEPTSLISPALAGRFFSTSTTWEAHIYT